MFQAIMGGLGAIAKPIARIFQKKQERKTAKVRAEAKLAQAKERGQHELNMTDAEAEALRWEAEGDSWRGEWVTVIITAPIALVIFGAVAEAFGYPTVLEGAREAMTILVDEMGLDMQFLMEAVVLSAVGLKIWRKA